MKTNELKKILKPLIKQCIKEVIFEEGVLSSIISEVATGLTSQMPIVETQQQELVPKRDLSEERAKKTQETKSKLYESIGKDAYNGVNVFENTEPLSRAGSVSESTTPASPLSNYAPQDAGINIEGLLSVAGNNWKKLL